jgi:hypothetical protein
MLDEGKGVELEIELGVVNVCTISIPPEREENRVYAGGVVMRGLIF